MALPTSTIVMAVLTCIPFGLAIRDTVTGKPTTHRDVDGDDDRDDSGYDAEYAAAEARREAEEAETARLEQIKQERLRSSRRSLFGAEVATLGTGFGGITLGMPEADLRSEAITTLEVATSVDVELLPNVTLDGLVIQAERGASDDEKSEMCSRLGEDLREAWGKGLTDDYERRYWVNPTTSTRASIHPGDDDCKLRFERFVAPKDWVNKTRTSHVPVWLVGQSIAKLRQHLAGRSELDDTDPSVRWLGLGVGAGSGEARFEAYLARGKVIAITVRADTLEATYEEVLAQLTALYGEPLEDDDGLHWKGRPAIRIDTREGAGVALTIGQIPVEE